MWLKQLILQNGTSHTNAIPLKQLIPFILCHLWNIQNKNYFETVKLKPSTTTIVQLTNEYHYLTNSSAHKRTKLPMYINWNPPPYGIFRLNTDGEVSTTKPHMGFSGVFRDTTGNWVMGYTGHHQLTNVIDIELLALLIANCSHAQPNFTENSHGYTRGNNYAEHPCRNVLTFVN